MMKFSIVATLCLASVSLPGCEQIGHADACFALLPPQGARTIETHAMDFILYPAHIPENYSGCGKVWLPNGHLLFDIKFEQGNVHRVQIFEPDTKKVVCEFDAQKKLITGPTEQCSGFENYPMWRAPDQ